MSHETKTYNVILGERGRLVLPAELRHELGLKPGNKLVVTAEDGEIRLTPFRLIVERTMGMFKHLAIPGRSVVDEFIAERHEEARREEEEIEASRRHAQVREESHSQ